MVDKGEWPTSPIVVPTSPIVVLGPSEWHDVLEALQHSAEVNKGEITGSYGEPSKWLARMNYIYNNMEAQLKRNPYFRFER
jgi:hypothetical protein